MSSNNTKRPGKELSEEKKTEIRYLIDVILYGTASLAFIIALIIGLSKGADQITIYSFGCCVAFLLVLTISFFVKYKKAKKK